MVGQRMVGRPDPSHDPVAKDDVNCVMSTTSQKCRYARDEEKQGEPVERPIGWGRVVAHHQVGKYKTASVTRKDVVTTELLCLAEADSTADSDAPQLVPNISGGHACIMSFPMFRAIPFWVWLWKYSH